MNANAYLKKPYGRRLTPAEEGGYVGTIIEFPGLVAQGDTANETIENLDSSAESWIMASLDAGEQIPEPIMLHGFSGKIALRIPRSLHRQVAELAALEGTSINQLLISAIAFYAGGRSAERSLSPMVVQQKTVKNIGIDIGINIFNSALPSSQIASASLPGGIFSVGHVLPSLELKNSFAVPAVIKRG